MNLNQRLFAALTGSPFAIPALGSRFYLNAGPQGSDAVPIVFPYCVYFEVSGNLLAATQDQQAREVTDPRRHLYQFSVYDHDADRAEACGVSIEQVLVAVAREYPGLQRVLPGNNFWKYDSTDRLHQRIIELDITEDVR